MYFCDIHVESNTRSVSINKFIIKYKNYEYSSKATINKTYTKLIMNMIKPN